MTPRKSMAANPNGTPPGGQATFGEAEAWHPVGQGWRQLFGSFSDLGFSFEWHDFQLGEGLDWSRSFHPGSVEICLNLTGHGTVAGGGNRADFAPLTTGFYRPGTPMLTATRQARERHQFITVEFAPEFLRQHLAARQEGLHPVIREVLNGTANESSVTPAQRLTNSQQEMIMRLRRPPVSVAAQALWYQVRSLARGSILSRSRLSFALFRRLIPSSKFLPRAICPPCLRRRWPATVRPPSG